MDTASNVLLAVLLGVGFLIVAWAIESAETVPDEPDEL